MKLLHIDSSITGSDSVSRRLTHDIVAQQRAAHPDLQVEYLDLAAQAPQPLSLDALGFRTPGSAETLSEVQRRENEVSEALVSQLIEADVVVIGAPMYNFTIPAQLKSWLDRVAQAGRTFKYTESGPVGLLGDKTVILALSRGGIYSANPAMEHQESYLKSIFGFMGVTDIRSVRAEGLNMGPEHRERGLAQAQADIEALLAA
ncbi:NAD(P)H-dependent oxidoreductase [uncultured Castellaniella sp.]|uniref:FMN-dependent NADH-azoreductase n=1 Tax=uncultured Castellaniella sp. TaxID=647907 RepID=UPI002619B831|nr:NAD(P)H-dependent oxidoreductase [uncultured Castellaniella sp.]